MSAPDRRALVDRDDPVLPVAAQCRLLKIARSTLYYRPAAVEPDDLGREGLIVNRKRVRRLMRLMGLEAIYQKPNTSQGHPDDECRKGGEAHAGWGCSGGCRSHPYRCRSYGGNSTCISVT